MEKCLHCGSENVYYSKKGKRFVCEDCDRTFTEQQILDFKKQNCNDDGGLKLFFSYGHDRNSVLVERIKRDLEKRGHYIWIDTSEIKAGNHWREEILNGILSVSGIIAFLSEHSTRNPGVCLDELKIAVSVAGANIKTVLLESENRIKPPITISNIQWLDMSDWYEIKKNSETEFEKWYSEKFAELCQVIESKKSHELSGDIKILETKLAPYPDSNKKRELLSKDFQKRGWLEDYISNWYENKSTKALMLYGRPGSGKSAFSVNFSHYNHYVYGCFLCEWNRENTTNPNSLIKTIAFRLATKIQDYRRLLLHQLELEDSLDEMNSETLFDFLLTYPLSNLVDGNRETGIIIVDGLDEAESDGDNPLASVFARCVDRLPRWIKFIFTSRQEKNVSKYFQTYDVIDIIEDMPENYNDILAYLTKALKDEYDKTSNFIEIITKISELSDGIFLYAELLVADIKNGSIKLSEIDSYPKGLAGFYRKSMERKFPVQESFVELRGILELLSISDTIPEELVHTACGYNQYTFIVYLDKLGSWVNRYEESGLFLLSFSHKSVKDWFTNSKQSGEFYVDYQKGALKLARHCRKLIENCFRINDEAVDNMLLQNYIKNHIGGYYIASGKYIELEEFLLSKKDKLDPYWKVWRQFPINWNNSELLQAFWESEKRNDFLHKLQREGNTDFLLWIFEMAKEKYEITDFDKEALSIYVDIVHRSGRYREAVDIIDNYLSQYDFETINNNEFLLMLKVRCLHHSAFYRPVNKVIEEALSLYAKIGKNYPKPYYELLFFIGGKYALSGEWDNSLQWLMISEEYASQYNLMDYKKRNIRKLCEYHYRNNNYDMALALIPEEIKNRAPIKTRYDAYLTCTLATIYTCMHAKEDEALKYYSDALRYATVKGIPGWIAHANLGIANVHFKLNDVMGAMDFASRARAIYEEIKQDWGLIMSQSLLGACESKIGTAPISVACSEAISRAKIMHFGSCVESIEELCNGTNNYLKLYFV